MLFVPTKYTDFKSVLLAVVLVGLIVAVCTGRVLLRTPVVVGVFLMVSCGLAWTLYGATRLNPGAFQVASVYVVWPIVYLLLAASIVTIATVQSLFRTMVYCTAAIGVYGSAYILSAAGYLPSIIAEYAVDQSQVFTPKYGLLSGASMTTLAPLGFLVPFGFALLATWPQAKTPIISRFWLILALCAAAALALLSGRRGLLVSIALAPIVTLVIVVIIRRKASGLVTGKPILWLVIVFLIGMTGSILFSIGPLNHLYGYIVELENQSGQSDSIRSAQIGMIWDAFADKPFFGHGFGATLPDMVRDPYKPWEFEATYFSLLYSTGIIGFVIYLGAVVVPMSSVVVEIYRDFSGVITPYAIPVLVGEVCFLIGASVNPTLTKFDALWVLFAPIVLLNVAAMVRRDAIETRSPRISTVTAGGIWGK